MKFTFIDALGDSITIESEGKLTQELSFDLVTFTAENFSVEFNIVSDDEDNDWLSDLAQARQGERL